jgi:hypothetical protein
MKLGEKQELFMMLMPMLVGEIFRRGYTCRGGELWRPPEMMALNAQAGRGSLNSVHGLRLAIDLNLFKDGVWLQKSEDHEPFGIYWEGLHQLCRWGGRFKRRDGNHYSLEHEGRK